MKETKQWDAEEDGEDPGWECSDKFCIGWDFLLIGFVTGLMGLDSVKSPDGTVSLILGGVLLAFSVFCFVLGGLNLKRSISIFLSKDEIKKC